MAAHADAIMVTDEGIILRNATSAPAPTPATPLRRQEFVCDCMETELSTSPTSVAFPDLPCGKAPALPAVTRNDPLVRCVTLPTVTHDPLGVEAAIRNAVAGVVALSTTDTTDEEHVAVGAMDGRALAAHGRQLQIYVAATSFRGLKPLQQHRRVMGALRPMIDSGLLHSVQIKCAAAP